MDATVLLLYADFEGLTCTDARGRSLTMVFQAQYGRCLGPGGVNVRAGLLTIAAVAALALLAAASAPAAEWAAPEDLSPGTVNQTVGFPRIAVARDGTTFVAYQFFDGATRRIRVSIRPQGGTAFASAVTISAAGKNASSPQVAVDRQDNATVVWHNDTDNIVQASYRPAGGSFQPPETLSAAGATSPNVAAGDNGAAVAVWRRNDGANDRIEAAIRPANATPAQFGAAAFISPGPGTVSLYGTPQPAMDAASDIIVIYQRNYDPDGGGALPNRWINETTWRAASENSWNLAHAEARSFFSSTGQALNNFEVVMTPGGQATAIWDATTGVAGPGSDYIEYADRSVGATFAAGSWSASTRASSGSQLSYAPGIAMDDAGNAFATWSGYNGSNYVVESSVRQGLGAFSPERPLSGPGGAAFSSAIAASPGGSAAIIWPGMVGGDPALFSARGTVGSGFGDIKTIIVGNAAGNPTTTHSLPQVGLDDQGNIFASWSRSVTDSVAATTTYTAQSAILDPVPPALGDPSIPASATAGAAAAMSASASDRISSVSYSWNFGDGGTATGASVSHVYAAQGTYTVTVTATDGAGNSTSSTKPISVSPAPPPDADHDGYSPPQDCNDNNAAVHPNAFDVPGNKVDENCDGRDAALSRITSQIDHLWARKGHYLYAVTFQARNVPKGATVTLSCSPAPKTRKKGKKSAVAAKTPKCRFARKSMKVKKTGTVKLLKLLGKKANRFRVGQKLRVTITAPNRIGRVVDFPIKSLNKAPRTKTLCLPPGAKKPASC
jgi:PKD repeat protein